MRKKIPVAKKLMEDSRCDMKNMKTVQGSTAEPKSSNSAVDMVK
jgi:hypothetical protein